MAERIIEEALSIVVDTHERSMVVRLLGSLGVRMHCPETSELHDQLDRRVKDIDVVCRKQDRNELRDFLEARGYEVDRNILIAMEGTRYVFRHNELDVEVDVFVDDLDFNHVVPVRDRLVRHPLSISLEDLVLHKLQVVRPTAGDHKDLYALLAVHDVGGDGDQEVIDRGHIGSVLASDWGFHRTATENLERFRTMLPDLEESLDLPPIAEATRDKVDRRVHAVQEAIAEAPKSLRWRLRAKVGERLQWWQDVDDPRDVY